jgi:hypothetical protein
MKETPKSLNFTSERLDVLVFETKRSRFESEWLFLFRDDLRLILEQLSPHARAILLDTLALGNVSPEGLICLPFKALTGRKISRPTLFLLIARLEKLSLVRRANGLIYLSPRLVYRGQAKNWSLAFKFWSSLLGEEGTNES